MHDTQNLVQGIRDLDPHIGGDELHRRCYNLLQLHWLKWSGGYPVPIEDTTLWGLKIFAAIAGKDHVGPPKEHDTIIDFFMKPGSGKRSGELVFKPGQLLLTLVIDQADFNHGIESRERVYELDDKDIAICRKVCIHNLVFVDASHSPHPIDHQCQWGQWAQVKEAQYK